MTGKFILGIGLFGLGAVANATLLTANFDSQAEGVNSFTLVDNGITFSNGSWNNGSSTVFVIDDASTPFFPGFSTPNVLSFGGYSPGPGSGGSRIGHFDFSAGVPATFAEMDVWSFGGLTDGNTITLTGYLGATVVSSVSATIDDSVNDPSHYHLALAVGNYDHFVFSGAGSAQNGDNFLAVDNVSINTVPEPASLAVVGLGALVLVRRRRK